MAPGARSKPLPRQVRNAWRGNIVSRNQQIPSLDSCPVGWPIGRDPLRLQTTWRFLPNHQVCRLGVGAFFGEIQGGKRRGRQSKPGEKNDGHPNLKRLKHRVAAKKNESPEKVRARYGPTGAPVLWPDRVELLIYGPSIPLIQEEIQDDQSGRCQAGYSRNLGYAVFHQTDMTLHIAKSYFW